MRNNRRHRKAGRRGNGWNPEQIDQLRHGHDFFSDGTAFGREDEFDAELAKACWDELGEAVTNEHIEAKPGSRPWAWWLFEAPEPRRLVAGEPGEGDGYLESWPDGHQPPWYSYGKPNRLHAPFTAAYEPQEDYLDRLGLLTPDERHALAVRRITEGEE